MMKSYKNYRPNKNHGSSSFTDPVIKERLQYWLQRVQRDGRSKKHELQQRKGYNIKHIDAELEIRLGSFNKEKYIGGVEIDDWLTIKAMFNNNLIKEVHSARIYYPKQLYIERYLDTQLGPWFMKTPIAYDWITSGQHGRNLIIWDKVAVGRRDFYELGMRAAFKLELGIDGSNNPDLGIAIKERHRTRNIYKLGDYYELHLTKVTTFKPIGPNNNKWRDVDIHIGYEIEIELSNHVDLLGADTNVLNILRDELIQYLSIIEQIWTLKQQVCVDIPYKSLNIRAGGIMNKPGDLGIENLPAITWRYTATDKADGERMFLIITDKCRLAMVNNRGAMLPISNKTLHTSHKTSNNKNSSTLGDMFDGLLDYLSEFIGPDEGKNNSSKHTRNKNYLDSVMPVKLVNNEWTNAVFDCEYLIDGRGQRRLYIFDCISCGNGSKTYRKPLLTRLACVHRFTHMIQNNTVKTNLDINIMAKTFYVETNMLTPNEKEQIQHLDNVIRVNKFSNSVCQLWHNRHDTFWYELDGIIFTPLDGPYLVDKHGTSGGLGTPKKIYKWKDEQTIDVRIYRDSNNEHIWRFYTGRGIDNERLIKEGRDIYYNSRIGIGKKGKTDVAQNMKDGDIIEMTWDSSVRQFVPYRNRTVDKNWPNAQLTISGIINLVQRPVLIEDLVRYLADGNNEEFGKLYYQEVEQLSTRRRAIDINMRDFHNWIKARIINQIKDTNSDGRTMLLDISVGKGGDIRKWHNAGVNVVVGIDISATSIEEARRRYNSLDNSIKREMDVYFIHGDSTRAIDIDGSMCLDSVSKQEWQRFINKYGISKNSLQIFDMIVSNFAIHYVIETDQQRNTLCSNLSRCLAPGGMFVGTLLDADIVRRELKNAYKDNRRRIIEAETPDGDIFYRIEADNADAKKIIVSRAGWANPIPEPAISANELCNILKNCETKWQSVHLDTFEHLYSQRRGGSKLNTGERYISFMHKTFLAIRN